MKKLFVGICAMTILFSCTGCSESKSNTNDYSDNFSNLYSSEVSETDFSSKEVNYDNWLTDGYYTWKKDLGSDYGVVNAQMYCSGASNLKKLQYQVYYYYDDGEIVRIAGYANGSRVCFSGTGARVTSSGDIEFRLIDGRAPNGGELHGDLAIGAFTVAETFVRQGENSYVTSEGAEITYSSTPFFED